MSSRQSFDNDNTSDVFEFTVGGKDYDFHYPTLGELEPIQRVIQELQIEQKKDTPESMQKSAELSDKVNGLIYGLVKPVGHKDSLQDTLSGLSVKIANKVNKKLIELLTEDED